MKYGFYNELDELRREDPDATFGFLENIDVTGDLNAFDFLHGFCPDFAAMLSDLYGYKIVAVRHCDEDNVSGKLIHAYCVADFESEQVFIDIRGITNDPVLFFEEFENEVTYYPEDGELWDLDAPVIFERWADKDSLFDGDYEGWSDNNIRDFITANAGYYSPAAIQMRLESGKEGFKIFDSHRIGELYHVGTMDISKKSRYSHEGNGLSVSNCPDAWVSITNGFTHGDYFKLSKPDLKLLDYYALTQKEKDQIQLWAIENGYVQEGTLFKAISWGEDGEEYFSVYASYEEALWEADEEEDRVTPVSGLLPTQKLFDQSLVKVELLHIPGIITGLYAEQVLDYDGVYWDEVLDIGSYSAPRGVIFNSKVSSFEVVNTTKEREKKPALTDQIASATLRASDGSCPFDGSVLKGLSARDIR